MTESTFLPQKVHFFCYFDQLESEIEHEIDISIQFVQSPVDAEPLRRNMFRVELLLGIDEGLENRYPAENVTLAFDPSDSLALCGTISFRPPRIVGSRKASLTLFVKGLNSQDILFTTTLGSFPIKNTSAEAALSDLVAARELFRLPSGYRPICISPKTRGQKAFYTNLVVGGELLSSLLTVTDSRVDHNRYWSSSLRRLADRLTSLTIRRLHALKSEIDPVRKITLSCYNPPVPPSDAELSDRVDSVLNLPSSPLVILNELQRRDEIEFDPNALEVKFALYQTARFIAQLPRNSYGLCLFGFSRLAPKNVKCVIDLSNSQRTTGEIPFGSATDPLRELRELLSQSDVSEAEFQERVPLLAECLRPPHKTPEMRHVEAPDNVPDDLSAPAEALANAAEDSVVRGFFLNSEFEFTDSWVDLGQFQHSLREHQQNDAAREALYALLARMQTELLHEKRAPNRSLVILNLCCNESGISREFELLEEFQYQGLVRKVSMQSGLPTIIPVSESERGLGLRDADVVIIAPIDTYVHSISAVVDFVQDADDCDVIAVIVLFSAGRGRVGWSSDVVPLLRLESDTDEVSPLPRLWRVRALKSWLVPDAESLDLP